jgi:hypothetical protein
LSRLRSWQKVFKGKGKHVSGFDVEPILNHIQLNIRQSDKRTNLPLPTFTMAKPLDLSNPDRTIHVGVILSGG